MNIKTVTEAISEAERFLSAARAALARQEFAQREFEISIGKVAIYEYWPPCAENAAAKRSSLDLSRALARMRKP